MAGLQLSLLVADCDAWNSKYPIGTEVTVRKDLGETVDGRTESEAYVLGGHSAVIHVSGIRGCYALDRVTAKTPAPGEWIDTISLWQPWATLIACEAKPFETRDRPPPRHLIGKRIAVHAAKKIDRDGAQFASDIMAGRHKDGADLAAKMRATIDHTPGHMLGKFGTAQLPIGCVVCTAVLDAAFQVGDPTIPGPGMPLSTSGARVVRSITSTPVSNFCRVPYDDFGNYAPGRWAWRLRDVQVMNPPAPAKGAQGFFRLPADLLKAA